MGMDWEKIQELRKLRSQKRSQERKELLNTPPKHHMMFLNATKQELLSLLRKLYFIALDERLYMEIDEQCARHGGPETNGSHYDKLTREDLLKIIYAILAPEIMRIDNTPLEDLGLLLNVHWSCPQLADRVKWRLENAT